MSPPTSVILPTIEWTAACAEVAAQLGPDDELLIVCDTESDPVAVRDDVPAGVEIVVAGEPERCSGKANAIAIGMEAARHDRIVWTDDDFHHPPHWLAELHGEYDAHGPVSEVPFFVGRDPLALLLEPIYAIGGTLGVHVNDKVWGGAVLFERADLAWGAFLANLRRTVSDDGLLSEYLDVTSLRRVREVNVGGTIDETIERHVRFTQIVRRHEPLSIAASVFAFALVALGCLFFPFFGFVAVTLAYAAVYAAFGVRRWTVLLAYPATVVHLPLFCYALARRTFVWGGRRYHWRSKFDVRVVE